MFQSRTALEKQADKLSAKQEELNIKSTGEKLKVISAKILLLKDVNERKSNIEIFQPREMITSWP